MEKPKEPRTTQQNRGLHQFCKNLANALNDAGLDMRATLKPEIEIEWTTEAVKNYIWKPFQIAMYQKKSTKELDKHAEITKIHKNIMRHLGQRFGLEYIKFPSRCKICKEIEKHREGCPEIGRDDREK